MIDIDKVIRNTEDKIEARTAINILSRMLGQHHGMTTAQKSVVRAAARVLVEYEEELAEDIRSMQLSQNT